MLDMFDRNHNLKMKKKMCWMKQRCVEWKFDLDRLTGTKFAPNPTNVQHEDQMVDEMLDTFGLSFTH